MDPSVMDMLLDRLREQSYPLSVDESTADALVECFRVIMEHVHEDDHVLVRSYYSQATSALSHPTPHE